MIKFLLPFILFASISYAQDDIREKNHPIDVELDKCLETSEGQTTVGMIECELKAYDAWDAELNKCYNLLMKELHEEGKKTLKASQKEWIIYREKEVEFYKSFFGAKQGTMWGPIAASRRTEIVRTRVLELMDYYDWIVNY